MISACKKNVTRVELLLCCVVTLLGSAEAQSLPSVETLYVNSQKMDLNVRQGPGTEYAIVTRLPHGTPVFVQEREGFWLRIAVPDRGAEGWVLGRYLSATSPDDPTKDKTFNAEAERQRFARLRQKGIIWLRDDAGQQMLQIAIEPLVWQRLSPTQQSEFLQRALRLYGKTAVEIRDNRTHELLARLMTLSPDEFHFETPETLSMP
jgi:Bacterial SH3 domain